MTAAAGTSATGAHLDQDARGGNGGAQRPVAGGGRGGTTGAPTAGGGGGGNGESSSYFGNSLSSLARRTFASLRLSRRGTPPPSSSGGGAGNRLLPASHLQDGSRAALSPGPGGLNGWGPGIPPRLGCVTAVGFAEDPNPRHRPTMEDAHVVLDAYLGDRGAGFFGIYDGHGGRAAVDVVATILHRLFEEELDIGRRDAAAAAGAAASAEAVGSGADEAAAAAAAAAAEAAALAPNDAPDPSAGVVVSIGVGGVEVLGGGRGSLAADAPRAMAAAYRRADAALADGTCLMAGTTAVTMFLHEVDELLPLDESEEGGAGSPVAAAAMPPVAAGVGGAVAPTVAGIGGGVVPTVAGIGGAVAAHPAARGEGAPVAAAPLAAHANGDVPVVSAIGDVPAVPANGATPAVDAPPVALQVPLNIAPAAVAATDAPTVAPDAPTAVVAVDPPRGAATPGTPPLDVSTSDEVTPAVVSLVGFRPVVAGAAVEPTGGTAADKAADRGEAGDPGGGGARPLPSSSSKDGSSHSPPLPAGPPSRPVTPPSPPRRTRRRRVLLTANVGDARAVLCRDARPVRLTYDHKASDPSEARRVAESGGFITSKRVNGVLSVARALGDHAMKGAVISSPHLSRTVLVADDAEGGGGEGGMGRREPFVVLACDGLWDVMTDAEVVAFVGDRLGRGVGAGATAKKLVRAALDRGSTDNISVMVVVL